MGGPYGKAYLKKRRIQKLRAARNYKNLELGIGKMIVGPGIVKVLKHVRCRLKKRK